MEVYIIRFVGIEEEPHSTSSHSIVRQIWRQLECFPQTEVARMSSYTVIPYIQYVI